MCFILDFRSLCRLFCRKKKKDVRTQRKCLKLIKEDECRSGSRMKQSKQLIPSKRETLRLKNIKLRQLQSWKFTLCEIKLLLLEFNL